jgi:hypothetical protein
MNTHGVALDHVWRGTQEFNRAGSIDFPDFGPALLDGLFHLL